MTEATTPSREMLADAILSTALDCIIVADATGRIVEFNPAAERTFGWARADILGRLMEDTIVPHRHRHAHRHGMARYLAEGTPRVLGRRVEVEGLHANGRVFPVELSITEIMVGAARFFVATLRDITPQRAAEAALQQARASLQAIFDNVPAALYLRDLQDDLVMINAWGARFLGRNPAEIIGQPISKFRDPRNADRLRAVDQRVVATGQPETHEFTFRLPDGDRIALMTVFPVSDGRGEVVQIGGMLTDVTELHAARVEAQEARGLLQAFVDQIPAGVCISRVGPGGALDQAIEFVNATAAEPSGLETSHLVGLRPYVDLAPAGNTEIGRETDCRIWASKAPVGMEFLNETTGRYESHTRFPILNAAGEITHIGSMILDVDDRVRAQRQLDETHLLMETVFDNIPAELYLREINGAFVMMNKWGAELYQSDKESMKGRLASEFDKGEEIEIARRAQAQLLATGMPVVQEYNYVIAGREVVVSNTMFPVRDAEGRITRIGGFTIEVTELHKARRAAQAAQATLRSFVDQAPVGIYINRLGADGIQDQTVEFSNVKACQPYGLTPDDFIGRNPFDVIRDEDFISEAMARDTLLVSTKRPIQYERLNPYDGRHESYTRFPILDPSGEVTHIAGMRVDIDERIRAERQLDEVRALLQSIFDNVPAELYLRRLDGHYIMANKWALDFYGFTEADLPHLTAETFDTGDGTEVSRQAQRELLATGRPVTREYHHKARGRDVVILNTIFPLRNAEGEIDRIGGVSTDITELHNARLQLERAQDSLHQSEKLAALGQLLAGIAHELNNPLAVVLGRAAILLEKLAGTPHEAPLQKLRDAANRCARIVKTFLAMARQTGPRRQAVEINHLIEAALEMTTYGLRTSGITWNAAALSQGHEIEVDQDQIVQVLINLILNAQHALEDATDPRQIDIAPTLSSDGRWLSITVADNGPGVPDAIAGRIFDPFFTTKGVGKGTGLGLSVCKSMVEAHGGTLTLETTPGGGATFRMTLPVSQGRDLDQADMAATGAAPSLKGRVLVVDDELEIAAILVDCLAPLGLDCVIAGDGHAALARVAESTFDAVFCDVSMPGMDGITFYHRLRMTNPILAGHFVFVSGDVLHRDWEKYRATVDRPIIEKPFDPQHVRDVALQLIAREGDA